MVEIADLHGFLADVIDVGMFVNSEVLTSAHFHIKLDNKKVDFD